MRTIPKYLYQNFPSYQSFYSFNGYFCIKDQFRILFATTYPSHKKRKEKQFYNNVFLKQHSYRSETFVFTCEDGFEGK